MNDENIHDYIEAEFIAVLDHITTVMLPMVTRGDSALMLSAARRMLDATIFMVEREGGDTTALLMMALKDLPVQRVTVPGDHGPVVQQMYDLNRSVTIADRDAVREAIAALIQELRYDDIPAITIFLVIVEQATRLMLMETGSTQIAALLLASGANEIDQHPTDRSIDDAPPRGH